MLSVEKCFEKSVFKFLRNMLRYTYFMLFYILKHSPLHTAARMRYVTEGKRTGSERSVNRNLVLC